MLVQKPTILRRSRLMIPKTKFEDNFEDFEKETISNETPTCNAGGSPITKMSHLFDNKVMVLLELFALVVRVVTVREEFNFQQS